MFAAWMPDLTAQPWTAMDDARLHDDCRWGCASLDVLALRQRRPVAEVVQRMWELGLVLNPPGQFSRQVVGS